MAKSYYLRRRLLRSLCLFTGACMFGYLMTVIPLHFAFNKKFKRSSEKVIQKYSLVEKYYFQEKSNELYENFTRWNRTLCSKTSDQRGPNQKVIAISIYVKGSIYADNPMYTWEASIRKFFKPLAKEIDLLLPDWILRVYIDFTGSTKSQKQFFKNYPNIDICDIDDIPMFGSSLRSSLSGRMWRFLPIFDPYVDYLLSRDLDSPIVQREIETINLWLSNKQKMNFFYIARDHIQHGVPILAGLWGAATTRARKTLFHIFKPMLIPSVAKLYENVGDQQFLVDFVWNYVKNNSLIFDSYSCQEIGGQPFLSQRPKGHCHLGCIRPCCINGKQTDYSIAIKPCPIECRPKEHLDWIYC